MHVHFSPSLPLLIFLRFHLAESAGLLGAFGGITDSLLGVFTETIANGPLTGNVDSDTARLDVPAKGQVPEEDMDAAEIAALYGYPLESYDTQTEDGYTLTLHRIPHGRNNSPVDGTKRRPVVYFQHGFLGASDNWFLNLPHQNAPFIFADAGCDVFLGNVRGNVYSRHAHLTKKRRKYWDFTFDHHARYDLPAIVDKILSETGADKLSYVGHSQGTVIMFIRLAIDSNRRFSSKIRHHFALAPVGGASDMVGVLGLPRIAAIWDTPLAPQVVRTFKGFELFGKSTSAQLTDPLCTKGLFASFVGGDICNFFTNAVSGPDSHQLNRTRWGVIHSHALAGSSTSNLMHWMQMQHEKGGLWKMNYYDGTGRQRYDLSRITVPTYLYYGDKDFLATVKNVKTNLIAKIDPKYVKEAKLFEDWNHADFIFGTEAAEKLYKPILKHILDGDDD